MTYKAQYAEAGCYYKKRYDGKLFKFKKFSIKTMKGLNTVESLSAGAMWDPKFLP